MKRFIVAYFKYCGYTLRMMEIKADSMHEALYKIACHLVGEPPYHMNESQLRDYLLDHDYEVDIYDIEEGV